MGKDLTVPPPSNVLELPAFGKAPAITLDVGCIREAESRFHEVKMVNPSTYVELSHCFNEAYRDIKRHLSTIGYHLAQAQKAVRDAKADVLLGSYKEFMEGKPKSHDNADLRDAFLIKDPAYIAALDRVNMLTAFQSNYEGKIKVLENLCSIMRQKMYLVSKSGLADDKLYVTSGEDDGKR